MYMYIVQSVTYLKKKDREKKIINIIINKWALERAYKLYAFYQLIEV